MIGNNRFPSRKLKNLISIAAKLIANIVEIGTKQIKTIHIKYSVILGLLAKSYVILKDSKNSDTINNKYCKTLEALYFFWTFEKIREEVNPKIPEKMYATGNLSRENVLINKPLAKV